MRWFIEARASTFCSKLLKMPRVPPVPILQRVARRSLVNTKRAWCQPRMRQYRYHKSPPEQRIRNVLHRLPTRLSTVRRVWIKHLRIEAILGAGQIVNLRHAQTARETLALELDH